MAVIRAIYCLDYSNSFSKTSSTTSPTRCYMACRGSGCNLSHDANESIYSVLFGIGILLQLVLMDHFLFRDLLKTDSMRCVLPGRAKNVCEPLPRPISFGNSSNTCISPSKTSIYLNGFSPLLDFGSSQSLTSYKA